MKKGRIHAWTMIAGLLLAAAMMFTHVLKCEVATPAKAKTEQAQTEEDGNKQYSYVSAPSIVPPASVIVHTDLLAHLLFEITLTESREENIVPEIRAKSEKLLLTLFRFIISPNAP